MKNKRRDRKHYNIGRFIPSLLTLLYLICFACSGYTNSEKYIEKTVIIGTWSSEADKLKWEKLDIGILESPLIFDVGANGNIYLFNRLDNRMQKFDSCGNYLTEFMLHDPSKISDLSVSGDDKLYILYYTSQILIYDSFTDSVPDTIVIRKHGDMKGNIEVDIENNVYVTDIDPSDMFTIRYIKLDSTGKILDRISEVYGWLESKGAYYQETWRHKGIGRSDGKVYDAKGEFVWSKEGFFKIFGVDDPKNFYIIYLSDRSEQGGQGFSFYRVRITKIKPNGTVLADFPVRWSLKGENPYFKIEQYLKIFMKVDIKGNVYFLDIKKEGFTLWKYELKD